MSEQKYKPFTERYKDPEYREKHLQYINEKIPCECGSSVSRCNIAKHKRSALHERKLHVIELRKNNIN